MPKSYKDVFTPEELAYLRERQEEALEKARSLPELTDEEDARIRAGALSDPDNQPLTDEELARFRPAYQVMPEFVAKMMRQKRGRPPVETPKKQVTLRLDQDVIDHFKAEGPGWQTRINDALKGVAKKAAARR
jgi:uncharacterized protein (DUF4415 family)